MVVLRAAIQLVREQIASRMGARLKLHFRRMLYDRALQLGPSYFDQQRTGDMSNTLVEDVERLEIYFAQYLPQLAIAALTPVILFAFMLALDLEIYEPRDLGVALREVATRHRDPGGGNSVGRGAGVVSGWAEFFGCAAKRGLPMG